MDLAFDLNNAMIREGITRDDLQKLRDGQIPGMPYDITDKQLVLFLNACNKDHVYTKKVVEAYYKARKNAPEFFDDRNADSEAIKQCFQAQNYAILPVTPDGYNVIYYSLKDFKVSGYHPENVIKTLHMLMDACLSINGPQKGMIIIMDMKGMSLMHSTKASFSTMRKQFHFMQECLPFKLHRMQVLNVASFYDVMLKLVKPFMKPELLELICLHKSDCAMEAFFKNCVPKSSVPSDYGGDCPSVEELSKATQKKLIDLKGYFMWEEGQRNQQEE